MTDTPRTDAIRNEWEVAEPNDLPVLTSRMEQHAQQLERELDDMETHLKRCTVLEWIPVSDMLPEVPSNFCLVIADGRIHAAYRTQGPRNEQYWRDDSGRLPFVTHWCPWPTAPTL